MKKLFIYFASAMFGFFANVPANADTAESDGSIYGEQTYAADDNSSASIYSIIEVDLSSLGKTPKAVSIKSNNGASLAGNYTYDETNKLMTVSNGTPLAYCKNTIQSDVVRMVDVDGSATLVRLHILPVMLTGGLTVTVEDADCNSYTKSFTADLGNSTNLPFSISGLASGAASAPYCRKIDFGAATDATRTNNWMATIPSNVYFSQLSTPGAHDAATKGASFSALTECQDATIQELLKAGVRAFDFRPGYYYTKTITADNLYIYHGQISTGILYKDAIATFATFLDNNPTEAITITMVKENCKPTLDLFSKWTDRSSEMWSVIEAVQSTYSKYMKILDHSYYTLGDFRGKICYINRTGTNVTNTTRITGWPDNSSVTNYSAALGSVCFANIQDAYNSNGSTKQDAVKTMLGYSSSNTNNKNFHFNFVSSANFPSSYASETNPVIATYLNDGNVSGPTGYMMCDYIGNSKNSGDDLRHAIINQNYKYVFSKSLFNTTLTPKPTDINNIRQSSESASGRAYDLQGRPVDINTAHGIIIIDGKKVIERSYK